MAARTVQTALLVLLLQIGRMSASYRYLDTGKNFRMDWTYTSVDITFTLTVNATGWVGLGFSPNGNMVGSDIVTAWVNADGGAVIQDRFATSTALPDIDSQQDYKLVYGWKKDGQTSIRFTRLLKTCDSKDVAITSSTTKVIYAYGSLDSNGNPTYHSSNRGSMSTYLLSPEPNTTLETDAFTVDAIPRNISIPEDATTYWCSVVSFQALANKHHIVKFEPAITAGNVGVVHHILMYACDDSVNLNFTSYDCFFSTSGDGGNNGFCTTLVAAWAVGGQATNYPDDVGLPIGGLFGPKYVLYQTHYNNPFQQKGLVDSSYIRLTVTPHTRPNDAGIIQTGVIEGIFVPPTVSAFATSGYCSDTCLSSQIIPVSGINIFNVLLHSHLLGRRITVRHFRGNLELPVIADDPHYDFSFQQFHEPDSIKTVLPGDTLQTVCTMNSTDRKQATYGGLTTMQEMCLSYLIYYPRVDLKLCQTAPMFVINSSDSLYELLNISASSINWATSYDTGLSSVNWTNGISQTIQRKYSESSLSTCFGSSSTFDEWSPPISSASAFSGFTGIGNLTCTAIQTVVSSSSTRLSIGCAILTKFTAVMFTVLTALPLGL